MVEPQGRLGKNPPGALAHAPGHPALLERYPPSSDPRQGRTLPWRSRTRTRPARTVASTAPALARRLSLGAQPRPSPRGPRHANPRQSLAPHPTPLQPKPAALGLSASRLRTQPPPPAETLPPSNT